MNVDNELDQQQHDQAVLTSVGDVANSPAPLAASDAVEETVGEASEVVEMASDEAPELVTAHADDVVGAKSVAAEQRKAAPLESERSVDEAVEEAPVVENADSDDFEANASSQVSGGDAITGTDAPIAEVSSVSVNIEGARTDGGDDDTASAAAMEKEEVATSVESPAVASVEAPAAEADEAEADANMTESEQHTQNGEGAGVEGEMAAVGVEEGDGATGSEQAAVDVDMAEGRRLQEDNNMPETVETEAHVVAPEVNSEQTSEQTNEEYDPSAASNDLDASLVHAQDEYDPAATSFEQHGSDEYDPANPSSSFSSAEYDPENPAYSQEEYGPSSPSYVGTTGSPSSTNTAEPSDPANKRKSLASETQAPEPARDAKRRRSNSHDSAKVKQGEDKKGLSAAAWDRLKDFQTFGEFQVNQVSRAAFASVGALPEFAQVSIIARFTRVPLKGVRDKNGQLMRIHHEYLKEHPHIAALQPVSVVVGDYTSDPGLFEFGYAPPVPADGMTSVPVPYQKEESAPTKQTAGVPAPRTPVARADTTGTSQSIDEFGRIVKKADAASVRAPRSDASEQSARSADPRRARSGPARADEPSQQVSDSAARKAFDPRRRLGDNDLTTAVVPEFRRGSGSSGSRGEARDEYSSGPQSGDPRRRNVAPSGPPLTLAVASRSELYDRLPASVRGVLDAMVREGRLRESINDNVISRLNHLPEHVAMRAVENFSNVDLAHIENLQGFLVGIINRVNEKAIAAERTDASLSSSLPRAAGGGGGRGGEGSLAAAAHGGRDYGHDTSAVLGYPSGASGRHGGRQTAYNASREQAEGYRNGPSGATSAVGSGGYSQQYSTPPGMRAPGPTGASGILAQQPHYSQQPQYGLHSLPLSVQQRLHAMATSGAITSVDEFSDKCYEALSQLPEGLANEVVTRFLNANPATIRNRSGFLIGVVKRCRQDYGFI